MLLGIDYGQKNVGIALSSEDAVLAFPEAVLKNKEALSKIKEVCQKRKITGIVLGQSLDFKGKPNPIMKNILSFKKELEDELKVPVYLEPEFLTTAQAAQEQGRHEKIDASAAAIILQSFIDKKNQKT